MELERRSLLTLATLGVASGMTSATQPGHAEGSDVPLLDEADEPAEPNPKTPAGRPGADEA